MKLIYENWNIFEKNWKRVHQLLTSFNDKSVGVFAFAVGRRDRCDRRKFHCRNFNKFRMSVNICMPCIYVHGYVMYACLCMYKYIYICMLLRTCECMYVHLRHVFCMCACKSMSCMCACMYVYHECNYIYLYKCMSCMSSSIYVCVLMSCIYVHIHVRTYMYVCMYVYVYMTYCMYMCVHICMCAYACVSVCACLYECAGTLSNRLLMFWSGAISKQMSVRLRVFVLSEKFFFSFRRNIW